MRRTSDLLDNITARQHDEQLRRFREAFNRPACSRTNMHVFELRSRVCKLCGKVMGDATNER